MILVDSLYKWRDVVRHKSFVIEIQGLGVLCRAKKSCSSFVFRNFASHSQYLFRRILHAIALRFAKS